jgi:hypothetical protein
MPQATPLDHEMAIALGDAVKLVGCELHPTKVKAGKRTYATLYWRALENLGEDYSVFVHVVDEEGKLVTQSDGFPLEGRYPTSQWKQGKLLGDRHTLSLPAHTDPGSYHLAVGMYLLETMERLDAVEKDGEPIADDRVLLPAALTVERQDATSPQ